jgi:hypothetical protein
MDIHVVRDLFYLNKGEEGREEEELNYDSTKNI